MRPRFQAPELATHLVSIVMEAGGMEAGGKEGKFILIKLIIYYY